MMNKVIEVRQGMIEFKWSDLNKKWELCQWFEPEDRKPYKIVICFFDETSDGYDMRTVGNRFHNALNDMELQKDTIFVSTFAMNFLNDLTELMEKYS